MSPSPEYWGGHFGDANGHHSYWGPHFPRKRRSLVIGSIPHPDIQALVDATTPFGAGVIEMLMEGDASVTYAFSTAINKDRSAYEQRVENIDLPNEQYQGQALFVAGGLRRLRSIMQRNISAGATFQLGLPYEEVTITDDPEGNIINVTTTANADWAVRGQRVLIVEPAPLDDSEPIGVVPAIIQAVAANQIAIDFEPGDSARRGGRVMPLVPVQLDPQTDFARYTPAEPVEMFKLGASRVVMGYAEAGIRCILELRTCTLSHHLWGLTLVSQAINDPVRVQFISGVLGPGIDLTLTEDLTLHSVIVTYRANVATAAQLFAALGTSQLLWIDIPPGYDDTQTIAPADFFDEHLAHGAPASAGVVGRGATVTTFDDFPVYDRGIVVEGTLDDGAHSLANPLDLGGVPSQAADARLPDWKRGVYFEDDDEAERQWLKLFLATVRGGQRSFLLPSWREDLIPESVLPGVAGTAATLSFIEAQPAGDGVMDGIVFTAAAPGIIGNTIYIQMTGDALVVNGTCSEAFDGSNYFVYIGYWPGITQIQPLIDTVNAASSLITMGGSYVALDRIGAPDFFGLTLMHDGIDGSGTVLVLDDASQTDGDFHAWYPERKHLQIVQEDETITHTKITTTTEPGDGTVHVGIDAVLSDSPIDVISWLEVCRFENDHFQLNAHAATLKMKTEARTIQVPLTG